MTAREKPANFGTLHSKASRAAAAEARAAARAEEQAAVTATAPLPAWLDGDTSGLPRKPPARRP